MKCLNEQELNIFIETNRWKFAKSYANLPHEYVVRDMANGDFDSFVFTIRELGVKAKFFKASYTYLKIGRYYYWTMGNPINETTIINRASDDNYEIIEIRGQKYMFQTQRSRNDILY